nr:hypothetical protein Iba_chr02fCG5220 [Ipomoea batatas]
MWDCCLSSVGAGGDSWRKKAAMRQTTAGMRAKISKKAEGSEEKRAVQRSVNMALLRPKYPFKIPETGPWLFLKFLMQVTNTAVFIHVVLFPPMQRNTHICKLRERLNSGADDKPLSSITDEAFQSTYDEYKRGGKTVGGEAGEEAESLADIFGDGEVVELKLRKRHERFEGV